MQYRKYTSLFSLFIVCAMFFSVWQAQLGAQDPRGTIVGTVTDPSGALVPGAAVVVLNKDMGTKTSLQTNEAGAFQASYLTPGAYQVTVELSGFKKYVRDNVQVQVNQRLELNVALEVGQADQSITVTEQTPLLNTTSGSMTQIVDQRRVAELPVAHGNPYGLIGLSAGVSFNAGSATLNRPYEPTHIAGYSMDGVRRNRSDLTIDGVPSTATANAGEVISSYVPPADIVQEFRVQTATFDASMGNTEGGVVNIAIKSGTNQLHGSGYYSKWTPALTANDWFNNAASKEKPDYSYNRWGGSLGGPVVLPKIYDGRNKTFFLWGYEGIHETRPRNNCNPCTVPTAAMKEGDFSSLLAANPNYQIFDPMTAVAEGSAIRRSVFPGNIVPASRITDVARKVLSYFPDPFSAGDALGNNNNNDPGLKEPATYYSHTFRGDHNLSERQRLFARFSFYKRDSNYNNYFDSIATGEWFKFISRQATIDDVYTISPTMLLNVRYGYNRFVRSSAANPGSYGMDLTSLGFPQSYNDAIPESVRRFPGFNMQGYTSTNHSDFWRPVDTHAFMGTVTKIMGDHSFKTGLELRVYRENSSFFGNDAVGRFFFDGGWTRGPLNTSAVPNPALVFSVASMLLGLPSGTNSNVSRLASYAEQSPTWGIFFQDDWRVNRKLTLNLGLRWEYEGPMTERFNRSVRGFDDSFVQPIDEAARAAYALRPIDEIAAGAFAVHGGLNFAGVDGLPRGLYETGKKNFMPRIGFAYQLRDKTVLRGGYGMFYGFLGQRRGDVVQHGFDAITNFVPTTDNGLTFINTLSNPFPNGIAEPVGAGGGGTTFLTQNITFFNPNPQTPNMQRWQFGIQHEFAGGFVVDTSYVGNRGTNVEINRDINATPQQYLSTSPFRDDPAIRNLSALVANPFQGLLPGTTLNGSTIARERLLRPYPQFGTITTTTNQGYSWYHSLQMTMEKRFSQGYTLLANYTFSKFMQANEYLNATDPMPLETISDQDTPHRITVSSIYELPFGRNKALGANAGAFASRLISGWQLQGIYVYQSGPPINFNQTVNPVTQVGSNGPMMFFGDINSIRNSRDQQTVAQWFNTEGFVKSASQMIDTTRQLRTFPLRFGFLRSDPMNNWDLSVIKNTRIAEGKDLQIRIEALNAFNHPNFAAPNTNPTNTLFGSVTSVQNYSRRLQLGARFVF